MFGIFRGPRPDITPAQGAAALVAGIPIIGNLLAAFDVYALNAVQQAALGDAVQWGGVLAGLLIVGDTGLRAARNASDGKVQAAALLPAVAPAQSAPGAPVEPPLGEMEPVLGPLDPEDDELPTDDEEWAAPPPPESAMVPEAPG